MIPSEFTKHVYKLSVEEDWDKYYEVNGILIDKLNIDNFNIYIFSDENSHKHFGLQSRFTGQSFEKVLEENQLKVNIYKLIEKEGETKLSQFFATGTIRLIK